MTVNTDTAGIAAAMLLSFTTLGAACWAMRERARAAHYRRAARRQEATVRWLHFRLAASRCAPPPPAEAPPKHMHPSATSAGRGRGVRRSRQVLTRPLAEAARRDGTRQ